MSGADLGRGVAALKSYYASIDHARLMSVLSITLTYALVFRLLWKLHGPKIALFAVITRCWPALLTVAVFEIVLVWNDLVIGLLFGGTEAGSVTLVMFEQVRQFATSAGPLAADAVVITLPPLILVLATGRWLLRGLAEGVQR